MGFVCVFVCVCLCVVFVGCGWCICVHICVGCDPTAPKQIISVSHPTTDNPTAFTTQDPSLLLLNGELVAAWHLDGLVEEAGVALQDAGKVGVYVGRWCVYRPLVCHLCVCSHTQHVDDRQRSNTRPPPTHSKNTPNTTHKTDRPRRAGRAVQPARARDGARRQGPPRDADAPPGQAKRGWVNFCCGC